MSRTIEEPGAAVDLSPVPQVARVDGDLIALRYQGTACTYRQLLSRADDVAGHLGGCGVGRGDRIAYLGGNSVAFFVAYLATAWLGAVFVPVNPRLTATELGYIIDDCEPKATVSEPGHPGVVATAVPSIACVVDPATGELLSPAVRVAPAPAPATCVATDIAALAYTSGTTGRPKGVMLSYGNYLWNCANLDLVAPTAPTDVNLVVAPLFHTASFGCFTLRTLLGGGTSVVSRGFDPEQMLDDLVTHRVNTIFAVPAMYQSIARLPRFAAADLSALRTAVVAGAPATAELIHEFLRRGIDLQQGYGLTETLFATCMPAGQGATCPGSAGVPMPNTEVRVVDVRSEVAVQTPDAAGEVWVRGPNVAAGMWRNSTAAVDADGWFHTGDIGCWDDSGRLFLLDRLKDVIIVGGDNVYSAEVERALARFPGLVDIAVVGVPDRTAGESVLAVLACADDVTPELAELRRFGADRLAEYKLPTRIMVVATVPRNAMGKIDKPAIRAALRSERYEVFGAVRSPQAPGAARRESPATASAVRSTLSALSAAAGRRLIAKVVAEHIADIVGVDTAAVEHSGSLTDLGMGSLAAVELCSRINVVFDLSLSPATLYDFPTLPTLARALWARVGTDDPDVTPATRHRSAVVADAVGEPLAIVGMSCRYPGDVNSPAQLWEMVAAGRDVITDFPTDRGWDLATLFDGSSGRSGRSYARHGGFLDGATDFDAPFFNISPREALAMDPQQRVLLEIAWEAFEHGRISPHSVRGTPVGVFVGAMYHEYAARLRAFPPELEGHLGTGSDASVMSGRVAYALGLEGPAITVDTACSSSLVAVHLAARSLRDGECDLALAGGVTVMPTPRSFAQFSSLGALAADGRCKSYAAAADGTAFGEGAGMIVLERLSDARRNGHPVLALLRGSAVNSDGASNGLTAPSGLAHRRMIRQALERSGLTGADIDVVEGHGTGTPLGDPIEAQALLATYGQDRATPLLLGSIKSNMGHTQAAAGVAGIIKMVHAMRAGRVPATLHVDEPSPHVDWTAGKVELSTSSRSWPEADRPRRSAVSSFGVSGTNAHVVLEQAPATDRPDGDVAAPTLIPWVVSGRGAEALRAQAERLGDFCAGRPESEAVDIGYSLAGTRAQLSHRAVVLGADRQQLLDGLAALVDGVGSPGVVSGEATTPKLALVFPGQGAQRIGMGARLVAAFPAYAEAFRQVCGHFDGKLARPLAEVVFAEPGTEAARLLDRTGYAQAALFAVEVALYRLAESWGITPDFLIGHSLGEIAAAYLAGVWDLPDATTLVAARGRLMDALPDGGDMVAVTASEADAQALLARVDGVVTVAAVNGPRSVVVAGARDAVAEFTAAATAAGLRTKPLTVSHAFHSPLMEPMLAEFAEVCAGLTYRTPVLPVLSNVTGGLGEPDMLCVPDYWVRHVRATVRYADGVEWLRADGVTAFVEMGPGAALMTATREVFDDAAAPVCAAALLRRDQDEVRGVLTGVATAHVAGVAVDWTALFAGTGARYVDLPTYAFQRHRYWLDAHQGAAAAGDAAHIDHPLVDTTLWLAGDELIMTGRLGVSDHPWLADHAVFDSVVVPAAVFVELALRAGVEVGCEIVEELTIVAPLVLSDQTSVFYQLRVGSAADDDRRSVSIHARPRDAPDQGWVQHATGWLAERAASTRDAGLGVWPPPGSERVALTEFYPEPGESGLWYGPSFQGLREVWQRGTDVFAEVTLPGERASEVGDFEIHPAILDASLHAILVCDQRPARLPFTWSGVAVDARGATSVRVRITRVGPDSVSVFAADPSGVPVLSIGSLMLREVAEDQVRANRAGGADSLFQVSWTPVEYTDLLIGDRLDVRPSSTDAVGAHQEIGRTLDKLRARLATGGIGGPPLAVVTHGGVGVSSTDAMADPVAAAVCGLVRAAQAEHPGRFVLVDTDGAVGDPLPRGYPEIAVRSGQAWIPRLVAVPATPAPAWDSAGTVMVTGAAGAIGALIVQHIVDRGARNLVLLGRSGVPPEWVAELAAHVTAVECDVADRAALAAVVQAIPADRPLTGVVHAAGVIDDGVLETLTAEQVDRVLRPKVDGAWNLHELTKDLPITQFVLFSSATATLGAAGQGNYAAANGFLDGLARYRSDLGLPAVSIAWGVWARRSTMTRDLARGDLARIARTGVLPLSDDEGLSLFDSACAGAVPALAAMRIDRRALRAEQAAAPLLRTLVRRPRRDLGDAAGGETSSAQRWATMTVPQRQEAVLNLVLEQVGIVLGHQYAVDIPLDQPFVELGFDSLTAVDFRNRVSAASGLRLGASLLFDHPTAATLVAYLVGEFGPPDVDEAEAEVRRILASTPIDRLRRDGLLEALLRLGEDEPADGGRRETADADGDTIEAMEAEDLVRMVLGQGARVRPEAAFWNDVDSIG